MLLALALSALSLTPAQAAPSAAAPLIVPARLEAPADAGPSSLAQRIAEARRRAAPPPVVGLDLRERQRLAALYPTRPVDGVGSAARRAVLGLRVAQVSGDERLGSAGRRAALSQPALPRQRLRR